jgi:hypothetical protein
MRINLLKSQGYSREAIPLRAKTRYGWGPAEEL